MQKKSKLFDSQYEEYTIWPEISNPAQSWEKKIWKNPKNSLWKKNMKILKKKKMLSKKNAILLVLLFEEISLRPELFSPPPFQNPGGVPWAWRSPEILVSNLGWMKKKTLRDRKRLPNYIWFFFSFCQILNFLQISVFEFGHNQTTQNLVTQNLKCEGKTDKTKKKCDKMQNGYFSQYSTTNCWVLSEFQMLSFFTIFF